MPREARSYTRDLEYGLARQHDRMPVPACRTSDLASLELARITAVHVRHAAHKATTQRDGRAASLRCAGRRRGRGPVQIVLLRLALLARVAFRAHLTQPQLSQYLIDLPGEFAR